MDFFLNLVIYRRITYCFALLPLLLSFFFFFFLSVIEQVSTIRLNIYFLGDATINEEEGRSLENSLDKMLCFSTSLVSRKRKHFYRQSKKFTILVYFISRKSYFWKTNKQKKSFRQIKT